MSRNQLDQETSPYLLQHRDNPVHWRAWNAAMLAEARASNKPILLSIGYAACHWCHVMAHETFEDPQMAALINRDFIPVKVDSEERPDLDHIYQAALQALGQQGGWPLTMFLTPAGEPFWGGTYFPPKPRYGRPGFADVLAGMQQAWSRQRDKVQQNVATLLDVLRCDGGSPSGLTLTPLHLGKQAKSVLRMIDPHQGGLVGAPKFPQAPLFSFLWRAALREGHEILRKAVILTCERISQGGIYDHLGGGYARYSTDDQWLVPHFEKMLYDNAQLIELLVQVWQSTREPLFASRISETIDWLCRDMRCSDGGFAASLDADSDGAEGKYYVWSYEELEALIPEADLADFCRVYGATPGGNWEGHSVLTRNHDAGVVAAQDEIRLARLRRLLLAERQKRVAPGRDDKLLADWNGMMIAALAQAGFALQRPDWLDLARRSFGAVTGQLSTPDGHLVHSVRLGRQQPGPALLEDYAQMARAALHLYEVSGDRAVLDLARRWADIALAEYWDTAQGGFFQTAASADGLIVRSKTARDKAVPAGNGVMGEVLARLSFHCPDQATLYRERCEQTVAAFAAGFEEAFPAQASLALGWELLHSALQIQLTGTPGDPARQALERVIAESLLPLRVIVYPEQNAGAENLTETDAPAAVHLCLGQSCRPPEHDPESLRATLADLSGMGES